MSTTANVAQFKELLTVTQKVKSEGNVTVPIMLHGLHGLGKSEIVEQWANENGYNCVCLYLSTQDVADLIGIPTVEEKSGKKFTSWAEPEWLSQAKDDPRPSIFFLDEMNRAPKFVLQTMLPFVLSGRLHTHNIEKEDMVIAAVNPDMAEYDVTTIDDGALMARFSHVYFEPEVSEWIKYCSETKCHPAIAEVVSNEHKLAGKVEVPDSSRYKAMPDRRQMWKIGQILNIIDESEMKSIGFRLISSMVGVDTAGIIMTAYNDTKVPTLEDVFKGTLMKKGNPFERMNIWEDLSTLNILANSLAVHFSDKDFNVKSLKSNEWKNITKFVNKLPLDCQFGLVRDLRKNFDTGNGEKLKILVEILNKIDPELINRVVQTD
jgi:hypothetical protein